MVCFPYSAQKIKFSIKDFFSRGDQVRGQISGTMALAFYKLHIPINDIALFKTFFPPGLMQ